VQLATKVTHRIRREADVVVRFQRYHIREKVPTRQRQVLDDQVQTFVRILNSWDRDVADLYATISSLISKKRKAKTDLVNKLRQYDFPDIIPKIFLEF
jgi:succinate dehydrogenase flavin-adding protein (antitoxin of CptAB toxin-antitoxin module)